VVVYEPDRGSPRPQPVVAEMVTVRKEFSPRLLVVPVGSTVRFPNQDPILHNVFSVSGKNRFDLGLLGKGNGKIAVFHEAGVIRVFCNVHHAMFAYVYVVASSFYARADETGSYLLRDLPPGPGKLVAWHERGAPVERRIDLPESSPVNLEIEITLPRIPPHKNKFGKSYSGGTYG
jgi:plastocyanin